MTEAKALMAFRSDMLELVRSGVKTQTRRPLEPQPIGNPARIKDWGGKFVCESLSGKVGIFKPFEYECPFGNVGDTLIADAPESRDLNSGVRLRIKAIKCQELRQICLAEIWAEGLALPSNIDDGIQERCDAAKDASNWFRELWDSIYGAGAYMANPWVWAIEFELVGTPPPTTTDISSLEGHPNKGPDE